MGNPSQAQQPLTVTTWELKSTKKKKSQKYFPHLGRREKSASHPPQLHSPEANGRCKMKEKEYK